MIPNQWYPILEGQKLRDKSIHVRRLGRDLVLWRRPDGRVVAQEDRCPHKGARLSGGRIIGDRIECKYHGFLFSTEGECVHAPCLGSDGFIPSNMRVDSLIAREEHQLIWLWHGDPALVRPELPILPELQTESPIHGMVSYQRPVHYTRYIESLLEFYHVPWVHRGEWFNIIDHFAIGGLHLDAKKRYYGTTKVENSTCTVKGQQIENHFELVNEEHPSARYAWKTVFLAPCLVYVENNEFTAAQWSTPIDDEHTFIVFKWLGFRNLPIPIIQKLLTKLTLGSQRYGQDRQDFQIMQTQTPKISDVGVNKFVACDELNAQYLHLRRRLIREAAGLHLVGTDDEQHTA